MKTVEKPWGREELLEINDRYMVKRLFMKKDHRCSLQYHEHKTETIIVESGFLRVIVEGRRNVILHVGHSITIEAGRIHRMEGVSDVTYLEASTPELDDVVRVADDYERE